MYVSTVHVDADLACRRSYVDPFGIVGSYAKCYTTNQYKDIVTGKVSHMICINMKISFFFFFFLLDYFFNH